MPQSFAAHSPVSASDTKGNAPDFAAARFAMIESQLRPNQVVDMAVIEAMGRLPRELFVLSSWVGVAYLDEDIPLISGRFLMQPMILARLIQAAQVQAGDKVLDLAVGTGYSTLVLASLTNSVYGVEPDAILHKEAEKNVALYAPGRATILAGAPVEGCRVHAPFDVILINGSVDSVSDHIFSQLAEGGRLVVVVRHYGAAHAARTGHARLYCKENSQITMQELFDANIQAAPGFISPRGFEF